MNHLANKIYMHAEEWEKYLSQHEVAQVTQYHALFSGPEVPWPKGVHPRTAAPEWSPSELFNKDQQDIRIGPWLLKATRLPGHTRGHMVYHETKNSFYFAGDLIYDGAIYLHLADSSLSEYIVSLERLNEMLTRSKDLNVKPTLFPSHNTIPLDDGYVPLTLQFARDVSASKIAPTVEKTWKKDSFFCEGFFFERGYTPAPVKMYLNSEIWKKIQNVKP
jgi:glyoxylase-like metal-dependent hydrolase (beta-lactamase superfamily II)